jgi:hypothetical protein
MSLVRCSSAETCGGFNDAIVSVQRGTFRIFFLSFSATLIGGSGLKGRGELEMCGLVERRPPGDA